MTSRQKRPVLFPSRSIFLLSCPRSGSSAISGALHRMGVSMGENLQVADELNPGGYYESLAWQRVNKAIGGQRYNVRWMNATPEQLEQYRRLIAKCSRAMIWGCKSPRLAYVFHHIWPLFKGTDTEIRVVWAHRDFENIVKSFQRHTELAYHGRWPMTEDQARALMTKWHKALIWQLATFPGQVYQVDYDRLLEEPVTELLNLHDYCYDGLDVPGHKRIITPALNWLDKELRHYNHVAHSPNAGPGTGNADAESGAPSGWTRKHPCRGCGRRKSERVDAEREQAPTVDTEPGTELDGDR